MKNKMLIVRAVLVALLFGGVFYVSQYNFLTGLRWKEEKIIKHGFRLLEEQIGTYIKEHYTGIEKIEFSPIYVTGDDGSYMFNAEIVPIVYDSQGNKEKFGGLYKKFQHPAYGTIGY